MTDVTQLAMAVQDLVKATLAQTRSLLTVFPNTAALPAYTVAGLPVSATTGAVAFASNGRKPGEGAAAGTGVMVYWDGSHWISASSGATVAA